VAVEMVVVVGGKFVVDNVVMVVVYVVYGMVVYGCRS